MGALIIGYTTNWVEEGTSPPINMANEKEGDLSYFTTNLSTCCRNVTSQLLSMRLCEASIYMPRENNWWIWIVLPTSSWWIEIVNLVIFLFVHTIKKMQHSNYYNNNDSFINLNLSCTLVLKLETHSPPSNLTHHIKCFPKTISRVDLNFLLKNL